MSFFLTKGGNKYLIEYAMALEAGLFPERRNR
jgi:hypothetical protein